LAGPSCREPVAYLPAGRGETPIDAVSATVVYFPLVGTVGWRRTLALVG